MKSHRASPATPFCRSMPARMAAFAMAVLFTASQVPAQPMNDRDTTDQTQTTNSQTVTNGQGNHAVPAAENTATEISAPVPNLEDATPAKPASDSMFAMDAMQDPSSSSSMTQTQKPVKAKAPLHGLGIAMAIVGSVVLVGGIGAFALSEQCKNPTSGECGTVHGAGIGMMAAGGGVAATGFYFQFHK